MSTKNHGRHLNNVRLSLATASFATFDDLSGFYIRCQEPSLVIRFLIDSYVLTKYLRRKTFNYSEKYDPKSFSLCLRSKNFEECSRISRVLHKLLFQPSYR